MRIRIRAQYAPSAVKGARHDSTTAAYVLTTLGKYRLGLDLQFRVRLSFTRLTKRSAKEVLEAHRVAP